MVIGVSVIICCYNSANRLPETLKHLAMQQVPNHIKWEVILIDNASTDDTTAIAKQEWDKYPVITELSILEQPVPGKNHAFEMGVNSAKYEYILTCDDDNWLYPNYVDTVFEIMQSDDKIGALGGCGIFEPEPLFNITLENYKSYYVHGHQHHATTEHWVYGAGSVYRKSLFIQLKNKGWQQITTGRLGKKLICGEDVEICFMFYLSGYKIIADDRLLFKHFIPQQRQNLEYIVRLLYWISYTNVLLNSYFSIINNDERPIESVLNKWFWGITKTIVKKKLLQLYKNINSYEKPPVEQEIVKQSNLGTFHSLLKNRKRTVAHHKLIKALLANNNDTPKH